MTEYQLAKKIFNARSNRHDTVLHKIIESLKSLILNIKQAVPISPKSFIKFVKRGTKVARKRTPPAGIIH